MDSTTTFENSPGRLNAPVVSVLNWWTNLPFDAIRQERRTFNMMLIGVPFGVVIHVSLIFLFAYWGIMPMVVANVFSVLLWSTAIIFMTQNKPNQAVMIVALEIPVHAALVIYFVGWGLGIQYYLFPAVVVVLLTTWNLWIRLVYSLFFINVLFILFYYYALRNVPVYYVDPVQLAIGNIFSISGAFLVTTIMTLYWVSVAERAENELEKAHQKSENLLNNILPETISTRLKENEGTIADRCENASILFADVVDFTPMSAEMTPDQLVELLNEVFSDFDDLTEKYGLEKIKTIGDCYMVAAGIPEPLTDHAQVITRMALDMQQHVENNAYNGHKLAFRIGINSGPVIAGVIGRKKFIYDLWGDAVNTASRMESHGQSGCIQITQATYELIKYDFECEAQGTIDVKGKGEMAIWYVQQEHND